MRDIAIKYLGSSILRGCNTAAIATSLSYIATSLPRDSLSSYVYKSRAGTLSGLYCSTHLGN